MQRRMLAAMVVIVLGVSAIGACQNLAGEQAYIQSALCPGLVPTDALLTGTAVFRPGPDQESGQVTLKVQASGESRIELNLSSGTRSEIRVNGGASPEFLRLKEGNWNAAPIHNTWIDANYFFPALSALVFGSQRGYSLTDVAGSPNTVRVQLNAADQPPASAAVTRRLSTVDYQIDPTTHLPKNALFNVHPDTNLRINIRVEVRFSDYRLVNGVQVPFHIERLVNGTPELDITLSDAKINAGLSAADFTTAAN